MTDAPGPTKDELLERSLQRFVKDRRFFASALASWSGGVFDLDTLAKKLACERRQIARLAMCRRPRPERDDFRADSAVIASYTGLPSGVLMGIARQAQAAEAFEGRQPTTGLLAARDVVPGVDEPEAR
jgi:hypothetical protein